MKQQQQPQQPPALSPLSSPPAAEMGSMEVIAPWRWNYPGSRLFTSTETKSTGLSCLYGFTSLAALLVWNYPERKVQSTEITVSSFGLWSLCGLRFREYHLKLGNNLVTLHCSTARWILDKQRDLRLYNEWLANPFVYTSNQSGSNNGDFLNSCVSLTRVRIQSPSRRVWIENICITWYSLLRLTDCHNTSFHLLAYLY